MSWVRHNHITMIFVCGSSSSRLLSWSASLYISEFDPLLHRFSYNFSDNLIALFVVFCIQYISSILHFLRGHTSSNAAVGYIILAEVKTMIRKGLLGIVSRHKKIIIILSKLLRNHIKFSPHMLACDLLMGRQGQRLKDNDREDKKDHHIFERFTSQSDHPIAIPRHFRYCTKK